MLCLDHKFGSQDHTNSTLYVYMTKTLCVHKDRNMHEHCFLLNLETVHMHSSLL